MPAPHTSHAPHRTPPRPREPRKAKSRTGRLAVMFSETLDALDAAHETIRDLRKHNRALLMQNIALRRCRKAGPQAPGEQP